MTRLQKKCFVAAVGSHLLLLGVLLAGAAFRPKPELSENAVLIALPASELDKVPAGGGGAVAPVLAPPSRPSSHQPPAEPAAPRTEPRPRPTSHEQPSPAVALNDTPSHSSKPAKTTTPKSPPATKPSRDYSFDIPSPSARAGRDSAKPSESTTTSTSRSNPLSTETKDIEREASALEGMVRDRAGKTTVVTLPGESSGDAFVGYNNLVYQHYFRAWQTPKTPGKLAETEVRIVVARDGTIVSARIVRESGVGEVDRSVQRALDQVKELPPFPKDAKDEQRSFLLKFNLEDKQSAG